MSVQRAYVLDCEGHASCCGCRACSIEHELELIEMQEWRADEMHGPQVGVGERGRGALLLPQGHSPRPSAPLAGFHQLGDDADGEGWS